MKTGAFSPDEDAYILKHFTKTGRQLAADLDRSFESVRKRRARLLRNDGAKWAPATAYSEGEDALIRQHYMMRASEIRRLYLPHRSAESIGSRRNKLGLKVGVVRNGVSGGGSWLRSADAKRKAALSSARRAEMQKRPPDVIDDTPDGAVFTTASGVPAIRVGGVSLPYVSFLYSDHAASLPSTA